MFEDRASPDPGEYDRIVCGICDTFMNVERNVTGATSRAEAMAGRSHKFDQFICPNIDEKWHQQAKAIMKLIKETPSADLAFKLELEAKRIVYNKQHTKESWNKYG